MSEPIFGSTLAPEMTQFVAIKRGQNFDYTHQRRNLWYFDRFLTALPQPTPLLSRPIFGDYVAETEVFTAHTRETRLSVVREFAYYLHGLRPGSALLPRRILPVRRRCARFYRLSLAQIQSLMAACPVVIADRKQAADMRLLVGLLYCCGLRISEVLNLQLAHVDLQRRVLTIHQGKFRKDRHAPLSQSSAEILAPVIALRRQSGFQQLLPHLSYGRAYRHFRQLCEHCQITGSPRCRLHDLRHNYASATLARWQEEAADLYTLLPVLSTVMGHIDSRGTQTYLHVTDAAIRAAFERLQSPPQGPSSCQQ
jgi:integrase/recombinase XerD